jgi:hypothetical protein
MGDPVFQTKSKEVSRKLVDCQLAAPSIDNVKEIWSINLHHNKLAYA